MEITGEWLGSIVYGKQYRDYEGEVLLFEMILSQDSDKITGESRDISGLGKNDSVAAIEGEFNRGSRHLNFIKSYQKTVQYSWSGKRKVYKENSGSKIYYKGKFNDDLQKFEGNWKIRRTRKLLFFELTFSVGEGAWSMKRKVSKLITQNLTTLKT
jgi:hypothetical protein